MSDIHPALRATSLAATTSTDSLSGAKTIGQLNEVTEALVSSIKNFLIPVEFANDGSPTNFKISVGQLLSILDKAALGLSDVDNTSDLDKPISKAVQEELDKKLSTTNITLTVEDIQGLATLLERFRDKDALIPMRDIDGLVNALQGKADSTHQHEMTSVAGLSEALSRKAPSEHVHSLTSLTGWNDFINQLRMELSNRLTRETALDLIHQEAIVVGVNEWSN